MYEDEGVRTQTFQNIDKKIHMVIIQEACEEIKCQRCKIPYQPPTPLRKFPVSAESVDYNYQSLSKEVSSKLFAPFHVKMHSADNLVQVQHSGSQGQTSFMCQNPTLKWTMQTDTKSILQSVSVQKWKYHGFGHYHNFFKT